MEYPVQRFIYDDLNSTPYAFAKATSTTQQNLSNWKARNKAVKTLPLHLLADLATESSLSYEDIYHKLLQYEIDYENSTTFAYIDSMVIKSAAIWVTLDNETKEKYASFQDFYKQRIEDQKKYSWNESTLIYQDKQLKKYIQIMKADLVNQWSADGYLDELEDHEIDMNGNFIDADGEYTKIMGFDKLEDLERFLSEDYQDFILQNHDYQDLDEEGKEFWRCHVQ